MAEEGRGLGNWWKKLTGKATDMVADQQAAFAHGKVAGITVTDAAGKTLVEAGSRITDEIIAQARQTGRLAALAASAVQGQKQDLKEMVQTQYARTDGAQEARLLNSVEDYREARRYLGRVLTMDVTDIRGHVVVPAGKTLDDEDVRRARDADLLGALLLAAENALPANPDRPVGPAYTPAVAVPRPAPRLLTDPIEAEPVEEKKGV